MEDVKILICCHKPYDIHTGEMYLPIQVGKENSQYSLDMQADNSLGNTACDNISKLNPLYCETTAMYWAWKNIRKKYPDIRYIGLCHYRRYFCAENHSINNALRLAAKRMISAAETITGYQDHIKVIDIIHRIKYSEYDRFNRNDENLKRVICSSDIVATEPVRIIGGTVENFFDVIGRDYIELLKEIVKGEYNEYYSALQRVLTGSKLNAANMIILKSEYLDEYCKYLFGVLARHMELVTQRKYLQDPISEKMYARVPGYLGELLTCSYIKYCESKENVRVRYTDKFFLQ